MQVSPTGTTSGVSVVIPTRGRGAEVLPSATSVLANESSPFQLIVVDQSPDDQTEVALRPLLEDPRFEFVKSETAGISAARNLGIERAQGDLIALTDDDCEVSPRWIASMVEAFSQNPSTGVLFGNVAAADHDKSQGFIPGYWREEPLLVTKASHSHEIGGMGACMAVRKSVWRQLEGFDERLGVGTEIGAGEDTDFLIRNLLAGHPVYFSPDFLVEHHGFRSRETGRSLIHRYWHGTGAAYGLNFRVAPLSVMGSLIGMSGHFLVGKSPIAASLGDRSHKLSRLSSFLRGFGAGLTLPAHPNHRAEG